MRRPPSFRAPVITVATSRHQYCRPKKNVDIFIQRQRLPSKFAKNLPFQLVAKSPYPKKAASLLPPTAKGVPRGCCLRPHVQSPPRRALGNHSAYEVRLSYSNDQDSHWTSPPTRRSSSFEWLTKNIPPMRGGFSVSATIVVHLQSLPVLAMRLDGGGIDGDNRVAPV
jgi:hypothetical protein